jgi:hypothetical protein
MASNTQLLTADAKNRAVRTLLQNLTLDVVVAVVAVLVPLLQNANSFGDFEWSIIAFSLIKTAALTAFSFIMRRFLDPCPIAAATPAREARIPRGASRRHPRSAAAACRVRRTGGLPRRHQRRAPPG